MGYKMSGLGHSALLRTLTSGALNRSGSLSLAQISQGETSHIPGRHIQLRAKG